MRSVHLRNAILGLVIGGAAGLIVSLFDLNVWGAISVGAGIGILTGVAVALLKRRSHPT